MSPLIASALSAPYIHPRRLPSKIEGGKFGAQERTDPIDRIFPPVFDNEKMARKTGGATLYRTRSCSLYCFALLLVVVVVAKRRKKELV